MKIQLQKRICLFLKFEFVRIILFFFYFDNKNEKKERIFTNYFSKFSKREAVLFLEIVFLSNLGMPGIIKSCQE